MHKLFLPSLRAHLNPDSAIFFQMPQPDSLYKYAAQAHLALISFRKVRLLHQFRISGFGVTLAIFCVIRILNMKAGVLEIEHT